MSITRRKVIKQDIQKIEFRKGKIANPIKVNLSKDTLQSLQKLTNVK